MTKILTINAGSSSIKLGLYNDKLTRTFKGHVKKLPDNPIFIAEYASGQSIPTPDLPAGFDDTITTLMQWLDDTFGLETINMVGHRIVHGGPRYSEASLIDDGMLDYLQTLIPLAPLHEPFNLQPIHHIKKHAAKLPQLACFDTAFHRTQPRINTLYALPATFEEEGIIRYGFHGLSYHYIANQLQEVAPEIANKKLLIAHLGNGTSICALHKGQSIATSMGFSALDGLMMGTRSGHVDPGILLYLLQEKGWDADKISQLLYKESGLKGVSGITHNMKELEESQNSKAAEAIDLFCHRAASEAASLTAALGGLDGIIFTAGIGENSAQVRQKICSQLSYFGIQLDEANNHANAPCISTIDSKIAVHVIPTNEEYVIAESCLNWLQESDASFTAAGR